MATRVHEGDVGSTPMREEMIHVGINSCMSITCICADRVVGGHAVMLPGAEVDKLARILQRIKLMVGARVIQRVFIIGSLGNWQQGMSAGDMVLPLGTDYFSTLQARDYMVDYNPAFEPVPVSRGTLRRWICQQIGFNGGKDRVTMITTGRLLDKTVDVRFSAGPAVRRRSIACGQRGWK